MNFFTLFNKPLIKANGYYERYRKILHRVCPHRNIFLFLDTQFDSSVYQCYHNPVFDSIF